MNASAGIICAERASSHTGYHAQPIEKRFLLRVDGQTKTSFSAKEPAAIAGAVIIMAFPVVVFTVIDTEQGATETMSA
jgi:hypothetical protein